MRATTISNENKTAILTSAAIKSVITKFTPGVYSVLIPLNDLTEKDLLNLDRLGYGVQTFKKEFQNIAQNGNLEGHKITDE